MLLIKNGELVLKKFSNIDKLAPNKGQMILLTGGIASGKTFTLNFLKSCGFATFNTDAATKSITQSDARAIEEVLENFPECKIPGDNESQCKHFIIDRAKLSDVVFANSARRQQLENIVYKYIRSARADFIRKVKQEHGTSKSIVIEIPMLFEKLKISLEQFYPIFAFAERCFIVSTISSMEARYERVMQRKNMTKEKFHATVMMQVSDDYRANFSDYLVSTVGTVSGTQLSIRGIVQL